MLAVINPSVVEAQAGDKGSAIEMHNLREEEGEEVGCEMEKS
jgi:hypothetical protein